MCQYVKNVKRTFLKDTFATAEYEILIGASKTAPDHVLALLLSQEPLDSVGSVDVDQVDLAIGHIHEYLPRILADSDACRAAFHQQAVVFFPGLEVVENDLAFA